ncbi:MAG: hypothetical protein RDA78_17825 [Roseibium sp.]|uniref:hypothetical protein n=1 Tax=Roseibium sp. TaxID=1936156 RepID=UPI003D9C436E
MAVPVRSSNYRRSLPVHAVPLLVAAVIVSSCNFTSIPESISVAADSSTRSAPAARVSAVPSKSAFLPVAVATARSAADKVRSAVSADHGDAAWICTASGFGQKSRCRARADQS